MAISSNTIEILIHATDMATDTLNNISSSSAGLGDTLTKTGLQLTLATAAVSGALGVSTNSAIEFEETMTNTAAVLGQTADEQAALEAQLLAFGKNTRGGVQGVAESFYDIVGGVADASTHMAILEAATLTAEAGNVDLASSTSALVSLMNAYSFEAKDATNVADIMTATVGAGVGTMGEFASAFPKVAGLAATLNIPLETVGGSLALLTTRGFTATEAATKLKQSMASLLNPNEKMIQALEELGYASGTAALEELGLVGALEAVSGTAAVAENGLTGTVGSLEALDATLALTGEGAEQFLEDFTESVDGAASAAQEIQMGSAAAQMDLLNSSIEAISIVIGQALLPGINRMIERVRPVLDFVFEWMQMNPDLTGTLVMLASAIAALGPVLMMAGGAIGVLTSPITLVIAGVAALGVAFATNFLGIRDIVQPVLDLFVAGFSRLGESIGWFIEDIQNFGLVDAIKGAFGIGPAAEGGQSWIEGVGVSFGIAREVVQAAISTIINLAGILMSLWEMVAPALTALANWFLVDVLPQIISIIVDSVIPYIISWGEFLVNLWTIVAPHLQNLADWFLVTALPAIMSFITDIVLPGIQVLIDLIAGIWTVVSAGLLSFADWFLNTGLPLIDAFIKDTIIPGIQIWIDVIAAVWTLVQPALAALYDWFVVSGLPAISAFINDVVMPIIDTFINVLETIWDIVHLGLDLLVGFFTEIGFPLMVSYISDTIIPVIELMIKVFVSIWDLIQPAVNLFKQGIETAFGFILTIINGISDGIKLLIGWIRDIDLSVLVEAADVISDIAGAPGDALNVAGGLTSQIGTIAGHFLGGGFASGTPWTGSGPATGIAGLVHNREGVIPESGAPLIVPTPNGFQLKGGSGGDQQGGGDQNINIQVSVSERAILSEEQARTNGKTLATQITEEIRYSG